MRTKQAIKNTVTGLILQAVLALSGIIIPRFFTELYGSPVNGLVNSISQFITYINLVEAGISTSVIASLYAPLANKDQNKINGALAAAKKFYLRSGVLFIALVIVFIILYPFIVKSEITDTAFIRTMIAVLSVSGIVDYLFLGKYRVLLQADQRSYVLYMAQIIGTVIMTVLSLAEIKMNCSSLLVKGTAAAVYILRSVVVMIYCKKHYPDVSFKAQPDNSAMAQRWDALVHQIAGMIVVNTDVVVLTLFAPVTPLVQVSIYSTYNLVAYSITNILNSLVNALTASFGQVFSQKDEDTLNKSYSTYEYLFFMLIFVVFTCMAVLIYPFIGLYSQRYEDSDLYLNIGYALFFVLSGFFTAIRQPAATMIYAAAHYKQTRLRGCIEAVINITVSLVLVRFYGINGVLIGTCASGIYRSLDMIIYNHKYLVKGTLKRTLLRLCRNLLVSLAVVCGGIAFIPQSMDGWISWFVWGLLTAGCSCAIIALVNLIFEKDKFISLAKYGFSILKR